MSADTPGEGSGRNSQTSELPLPGEEPLKAPAFLFINGCESSRCDLHRLVNIFSKHYPCDVLTLNRENSQDSKLSASKFKEWQDQVVQKYNDLKKKSSIVYFVGFCAGGMLALDLAANVDVGGVLSISTFFRPRRYRRHRISSEFAKITDLVSVNFQQIKCPVLLLHSCDDKEAVYDSVAEMVKVGVNTKSLLVTFFGLDHFLPFHIPPDAICNLALKFFGLTDQKTNLNESMPAVFCEQLKIRNDESRHWSGILFSLVVGFYAVMGVLLYHTLPDVLKRTSEAPYYLISYSLVTSLYIKLSTLYFFYLNRVDSYIKYHLEPYIMGIGWTAFRTNRWASGTASHIMTPLVTYSEASLTFLISLTLLIYTSVSYNSQIFSSSGASYFLLAGLVLGFLMWLIAGATIWTLIKYGQRLYAPVVPQYTTSGIEELLDILYASVEPNYFKPRP